MLEDYHADYKLDVSWNFQQDVASCSVWCLILFCSVLFHRLGELNGDFPQGLQLICVFIETKQYP